MRPARLSVCLDYAERFWFPADIIKTYSPDLIVHTDLHKDMCVLSASFLMP